MGLLKMFGKKASGAMAEASNKIVRMENKDLVEGVVYGCVYMAHADGDLEDSELENLQKQINANEIFDGFPKQELGKMIDRAVAFYDVGKLMGDKKCLKQISEVAKNPEWADEVMMAVMTVAAADGEIEPAEVKAGEAIAKTLGLKFSEYYVAE
jgi:Tellurite resistance protein